MKRNYLILALSITLVILAILVAGFYFYGKNNINADTFLSRRATACFDYNELAIKSNKPSLEENISILHNGVLIWENNKEKKRILNVYGPNKFEVFYNNKLACSVYFFKKNNWHVNKYIFDFAITDKLEINEFIIEGPDKKEGLIIEEY